MKLEFTIARIKTVEKDYILSEVSNFELDGIEIILDGNTEEVELLLEKLKEEYNLK